MSVWRPRPALNWLPGSNQPQVVWVVRAQGELTVDILTRFAVVEIESMEGRNGRPYIRVTLEPIKTTRATQSENLRVEAKATHGCEIPSPGPYAKSAHPNRSVRVHKVLNVRRFPTYRSGSRTVARMKCLTELWEPTFLQVEPRDGELCKGCFK